MTESEAKTVIRRLLAILPSAKAYYARETDQDTKAFVYRQWVQLLLEHEVSELEPAFTALAASARDVNTTTYPVQSLLSKLPAKPVARTPTAFQRPDRTPRSTNMLDTFRALLNSSDDTERAAILDSVL